jgi:5-methyltetrahydrofolate--homocysteine methyltransferase
MVAAPAGELHVIALRMVANLLREGGYDVLMLGADVPPEALAKATHRHRAEVVCLSTTMPGGGDQVLIAMYEVQQQRPEAMFLLGGRGLTSRVRSGPGVQICERVSDAVEAADALVKRAALN